MFLLTLYLQDILGYSALAAGATFAVLGAGTVLGGMLGPRVIARVGARRALAGGLLVQARATLPLVALGSDGAWIVPLLVAISPAAWPTSSRSSASWSSPPRACRITSRAWRPG